MQVKGVFFCICLNFTPLTAILEAFTTFFIVKRGLGLQRINAKSRAEKIFTFSHRKYLNLYFFCANGKIFTFWQKPIFKSKDL